ncbi:MAG: ABC transporter permease [Firmicutes bacterium]|nr:ABC transporter permease [Bacillota bacterium]
MRNRRFIDFSHSWSTVGIYLILAAALGILAFINPSFFTETSLINLAGTALPLIFAGMAQTVAVLVKGIDLSVGSAISLVTVIAATLMQDSWTSIVAVTALSLLIGLLIGAVNGGLVVIGRLQAIIVTLATSSILSGIALFIMPQPGGSIPGVFAQLVGGSVGPVPLSLLVLGLVIAVIWLPFRNSRFGQGVYAVGGNEQAAYYSGISVKWVTCSAYIMSGLLAALAGLALAAQALSGDPTIGAPYTLNSIAAVVLGGTSLAGGRGGIAGSIAGALVLSIIVDILFFLGVSAYYQYIFSGLIVIIALAAVGVGNKLQVARSRKQGSANAS